MKQLIALLLFIPLLAGAILVFTPQEFATRLQQQGPERALKQISPCEWQTLIAGVSKGNKAWLVLVPEFAQSIYNINDWQKNRELSTALAFSLVNNPAQTLTMMRLIDQRITAMADNNASLVDFGSMTACDMPLLLDYDRDSNMRYYYILSARLRKLGKLAEECLNTLNESMEETKVEEKRGTMKWRGTKSWQP